MKIDRRSFLSFGIGAAAGIGLSPLPWKLTDDLSIWSQNWSWTPVPEDGEVSYVNSVCTLCPGGCGITVKKVENRAIKIEGMKGYPGNDGKACPLGLSGLQLLYGPTAVKSPMKKVDGKWQKISWDEAITEISGKLAELRKSGKAHTLGCITESGYGTVPALFKRFLTAYGSPNFMTTPSYEDSYDMTLKLMQGVDASAGFDMENANFVLSFGSGLIEGWGTPARMFRAHSAWKDKGVKVVQVEPRLSSTAARADKWVPVNPGTEGVLALGIAHVMIKEGLYNKDFVSKSFGFEDFKDSKGKAQKGFKSIVLENYTPSKVSGITGVDTGTIAEIAKAFAAASAPLALCGRGQGKTPGSIHEFIAVHALNALTGNINKKGGICAIKRDAYINWPAPEADAVAKEGLKTARADGAGAGKYAFAKSLLNRLPGVINAVEKEEDLPIQALFIRAANPAYTLTDAGAAKAALEKIPFIVCFASCMNETAEMADFILPEPGHLERCEDVPVPFGMNVPVMGLAKPVINPQYKTMPAGDVLMLLAQKLGDGVAKAFPWKNHAECLEKTLAGNWKPAMEKGFVALNTKPESGFATGSGKFEFMSAACAHDGKGGAFTGIEGDDAALPLVLIPCDSMRLASGPVADTPFVMKIVEDTVLTGKDSWVEINGKTGGKCGLAEGVYAKLTTAKGTFRVRVHINNGLKPGVIAMPRGLGHTTAVDEYMSGKGINVNELMGTVEDPASGLDATVGTRAALVIA